MAGEWQRRAFSPAPRPQREPVWTLPMFGHWLRFRGSVKRPQESLARQVAELSVEVIYRLVAGHTRGMTPCEARGYVRARSAREISRQTRMAVSRWPGADLAWESSLRLAATERVVPLVMRALTRMKPATARLPAAESAQLKPAA